MPLMWKSNISYYKLYKNSVIIFCKTQCKTNKNIFCKILSSSVMANAN